MKKLFLSLLISTLLTTFLSAEEEYGSAIYGVNVKDWKIYTTAKGEISKDVETDSIKLVGKGTSTGFYTQLTPLVNDADTIKFRIKYSHYFKVYVQVLTTNGIRYLTYYPLNKDLGKNGRFLQFGLGRSSRDGKMQEFTRDLKTDLEKFDAGNKLLEVRAFFIRGSGLVKEIMVLKLHVNWVIAKNKLRELLYTQGTASAGKEFNYGTNVIVSETETETMPDYPTSFYTLSKDEKELYLMFTIGHLGLCKDAVTFEKDNTLMIIHYPDSNTTTDKGVWRDTYDISDLYNTRRVSHVSIDNFECN